MTIKRIFVVSAVTLLLASCNVQTVDETKPIAVADTFFTALKSGNDKAALNLFSPEFKAAEKDWPRLLANLQQKYGPVTSADLQDASLAAKDDDPCYMLTYAIKRNSLASTESLFICSKGNVSPWLVVGHNLTRLDTNQSIAAGMLPVEASIKVP